MLNLNNGLTNFLFHVTSRDIAKSLFSIFIPLFLLANGVSLFLVGIYFLIQEVFTIFLTSSLFYKIHKWGVKRVAIMGILFQIFAIILLYFISADFWIIALIGFARGVSHGFYWAVYDMFFVHTSDGHFGKELGNFYFLAGILGALIIPFSGFILEEYSPLILIISSICLELVSIYFLSKIKISPLIKNHSKKSLFGMFKKRENRYMFRARNLIEICENTGSTILPIFIYLVYDSLFISGLFLMGASIFTGIYSYYLGGINEYSKNRRFFVIYINIFMFALLLLIVYLFQNPFSLILATIGLPFFRQGIYLTIITGVNESCRNGDCYNKLIFSRIGENIASIFIALTIILFSFNFRFSFLAIIVLIFFSSFFLRKYKEFINGW